jgi:hypothetical protein
MKGTTTTSQGGNRISGQPALSPAEWDSTAGDLLKKVHRLRRLRSTVLGILLVLPIVGGIVGIKVLQS